MADEGAPHGKSPQITTDLEAMMSLKPGDDERTTISKKVSWILRHGAKQVDIEMDDDGWVRLEDLLASPILEGVEEGKLMEMVDASNVQKSRYEVRDSADGKAIRAVAKHTIEGMAKPSNQDRRRRDGGTGSGKGRGRGGSQRSQPETGTARDPEGWRAGAREPEGWRAGAREPEGWRAGAREPEGWRQLPQGAASQPAAEPAEGPTFEQQVQEGFWPVFLGGKVIAMHRGNETVEPGRKGSAPIGTACPGTGQTDGKGFDGGPPGRFDGGPPGRLGSGPPGDWQAAKGGKKGKGKDFSDVPGASSRDQIRWVCQQGQDALVRATLNIESPVVGSVHPGQIVTQTGEEMRAAHGILRMPVEFYNEKSGQLSHGWVTRTAEACNGPVYFRPVGVAGVPSYRTYSGVGALARGAAGAKGSLPIGLGLQKGGGWG